MKKYLLATAAAAIIASPAVARDGQPYIGIEGGVLFPKDQDADIFVNYNTTQTVPTTPSVAGPADAEYEDAVGIDYKKGLDVDAIIGYDFGMFRLEGEIGWKRAKLNEFEVDQDFIDDLNDGLNRPDVDVAPDPVDTLPPLVADDFDIDGKTTVLSAMINALIDVGNEDGLSFYGGVGFGRARVKFAGERDSAWAGQLIAGMNLVFMRPV